MSSVVKELKSLEEEPWRYDFFSAMKMVENAYPDFPSFGCSRHLKEDPVRLGQYVSLAFESAMVKQFSSGQGKPSRLEVTFFGLTGPDSPMPLHLSEETLARKLNQKDPSLAHFLDIFHHRLLCVLYRSWAQARYGRCLIHYISALTGTLSRPAMMPAAKALPGEFIEQRRSEQGLRDVLWQAFGLLAEVLPLCRSWLVLPDRDHARLGDFRFEKGIPLGKRVCSVQNHFILTLLPGTFSDYQHCLPGHPQFDELVHIVRRYVGESMFWTLIVKLPASQRPHLHLGNSLTLGRSIWLGKNDKNHAVQDFIFNPVRFYS